MAENARPWFRTESLDSDAVAVEFLPAPDRFWPPDVLVEAPVESERLRGKDALLTGKGAMWMYAHAAARAAHGGVKRIRVAQPHLDQPVAVWPLPDADSQDAEWFFQTDPGPSATVIHFREPLAGRLWPEDSVRGARAAQVPPGVKTVFLTGRGANWMYAATAAQAVARGAGRVAVFDPNLSVDEALVVSAASGELWIPYPRPAEARPGLVLGIVGDPGSGKSVLAKALDAVRSAEEIAGWVKECDAAAPTPYWYIRMEAKGRGEEGRQFREDQKRPWSPTMERLVAEHLRRLKHSMTLLIADLPGGLHRDDAEPQRIPPGREGMLEPIDRFIILGREGDCSAESWLSELERRGWRNKVVAIWSSAAPQAEPHAELYIRNEISYGRVQGLDRTHHPGTIASALARARAGEWLRKLVEDWMNA